MDTNDCCDWHGILIAQGVKEKKGDDEVSVAVFFCPECNSVSKSYESLTSNQTYLTERLWGVEKDRYLAKYNKV
jgi:hypothetical protein